MKKLSAKVITLIAVVLIGATTAICLQNNEEVSTSLSNEKFDKVASTIPPDPNWIISPGTRY